MPIIETSAGVNIHYEEMGEGRPLVLLHGWAGSGRLWRFQHELADGCRLVIPDLRGHGLSSAPAEGFGLDDLVSDIFILFERLGLSDAILLGWSLGSQVALAAFPRLQERLAGLVLVGATARFTAMDGYPHGLPANKIRGMGLRLRREFARTMGEFFRSMFAQGELTPGQEGRIGREILAEGRLPTPEAAHAALAILASADLRERLPAIDCPVLILHGSEDTICPPGSARFLAERLPDARLVAFAGAGHAPSLSRPEQFNALIREFLQKDDHDRH
jgi:pimeloyl-[acyl-carrier protein] methyl ester esterase